MIALLLVLKADTFIAFEDVLFRERYLEKVILSGAN